MNGELVQWVLEASTAEGAVYTAHLVLALHADEGGRVRVSQAVLAHAARLNVGTLRRAVRALIDTGAVLVVDQPRGRGSPAVLELVVDRAHGALIATGSPGPLPRPRRALRAITAPTARDNTEKGNPLTQGQDQELSLLPTAPTARSTTAIPARIIVKQVWETRSPRPAQSFMGVVKVAEALLDAGWTEAQVLDAMLTVPAISVRSCEWHLNRGSKPKRAVATDDRTTPSGRISL